MTIRIPRLKKGPSTYVSSVNSGSYGIPVAFSAMNQLCSQFVSGQLQKFVGVYANSDIVLLTSIGDPTELALRDLARILARAMDNRCRSQLSNQGAYVGAGGLKGSTSASLATAGGQLRPGDIARAAVTLDAGNNPRPPDGNYPLVIHPYTAYDILFTLSSGFAGAWSDINKYATNETVEHIYRGELGRLFGARIVTSTNIKRMTAGGQFMSAGACGFLGMMFAPEAYYVVESDDMTARTIVKPLGSGGTYDPDNSLSTVAAKVFFECIPGFQDITTTPKSEFLEYRMVRVVSGLGTSF